MRVAVQTFPQEVARTLCAQLRLRKSGNTDAASFQSCHLIITVILVVGPLINEPLHVFSLLRGWASGSPFQFDFMFPNPAAKKAWKCHCTSVQPLDVSCRRNNLTKYICSRAPELSFFSNLMHFIRATAPVEEARAWVQLPGVRLVQREDRGPSARSRSRPALISDGWFQAGFPPRGTHFKLFTTQIWIISNSLGGHSLLRRNIQQIFRSHQQCTIPISWKYLTFLISAVFCLARHPAENYA